LDRFVGMQFFQWGIPTITYKGPHRPSYFYADNNNNSNNNSNKYECTIDQELADAAWSVDGHHDRHRESMMSHQKSELKNNSVKFHPDQIWNDRALGFFGDGCPKKKKKKKMQ